MIRNLQRVLEPTYLSGLVALSTDHVREMRRDCTDLENGFSYVRRVAQGRLDLLSRETESRASGGGGDLRDLVERLPEMLSAGVRGGGGGRVEQELQPPDHVVDPLTDKLDGVVGPSVIASVAELPDEALSSGVIALSNFEEELSTARRSLHSVIDSINDELARRISNSESPVTPA
ncbi:MAG: hypothetical protein P8L46_11000 [Acidimicrobiales bacterium]|nr:hypothetical protein [Acidimicrobiales bacterium]MDG2218556.1 hypothetical protein [Acidimicrobiales bacterium]